MKIESFPEIVGSFPERITSKMSMLARNRFRLDNTGLIHYNGYTFRIESSVQETYKVISSLQSEIEFDPTRMNNWSYVDDILTDSKHTRNKFNISAGRAAIDLNYFKMRARHVESSPSASTSGLFSPPLKIVDTLREGRKNLEPEDFFNAWWNVTGRRVLYVVQQNPLVSENI